MAELAVSRRTRTTPFTSRVESAGVQAYTVYNHMLLASNFRGLEADYWHLCQHVQVWDVSCERQIQIKGPDADRLVQWMTPRDLSRAKPDQCFYVPLCDEHGNMINDPIAMRVGPDCWWLSIADSDVLLWAKGLAAGKGFDVEITEPSVWPIAIQGPKAETLMQRVFGDVVSDIRFFRFKRLAFEGHEFIVARSGWSKQGGFEVYVDDAEIGCKLWDTLFEQGADLHVGPGCPNLIERIESGLMSFGNDMGYEHTPLQCGLEKYCQLDKPLESLSQAALLAQRERGVPQRLVGLVVPGMPEAVHQATPCFKGLNVGEVSSSCLSARYDAWLGFAMIDSAILAQFSGLAAESRTLTLSTDAGDFEAWVTELPFDFSALPITLRPSAHADTLIDLADIV